MLKPFLLAAALALAPSAHAQGTSPAKKELVAKVLQIRQPGIEGVARSLVEQPAMQMLQQAALVIQARVPEDKREALGKAIEADIKQYIDDAYPIVRERALKLAPATIGATLEEKFSEDELKQLIALLESPVNKKFEQASGEMQRGLVEKLANDSPSPPGRGPG